MKANTLAATNETKTKPNPEDRFKPLQCYLHMAIAARQSNKDKPFKAIPGPDILTHCLALSHLRGNVLAAELAAPITAVLDQLARVSNVCTDTLKRQDKESLGMQEATGRILDQVDFALAMGLRRLVFMVEQRAEATRCRDFLGEVLGGLVLFDGARAASLIRRWEQLAPDEGPKPDGSVEPGSFHEQFAMNVFQRVEALDEFADEFPAHLRNAAGCLPAWPMLRYPHQDNRQRFEELARRLELGADCLTDASAEAQFEPSDPLVKYLCPRLNRLQAMRDELGETEYKTVAEEQAMLNPIWWQGPAEPPGEAVINHLRTVRRLPPLTKATAAQWAGEAMVPLILATDAIDYRHCPAAALKSIAAHKEVVDAVTFEARLLIEVTATLRQLARAE